LSQRFKVTAYPTLLFINGDGEVFHKVLGAKQAEEFLKIAQKVVADY
jgi:thioredoxin-related protein